MDEAEIDRVRKTIRYSFRNSLHKKKYWLALLEMYGNAQGTRERSADFSRGPERAATGRAGVDPLRCALLASRKPWVTVSGHPSNACVRPMEAAGKTYQPQDVATDASRPGGEAGSRACLAVPGEGRKLERPGQTTKTARPIQRPTCSGPRVRT